MLGSKSKLVVGVIFTILLVLSGNTVHNLNSELEEERKQKEELERELIDTLDENKALFEEMDKINFRYGELEDKLEEIKIQLKEKDEVIEGLENDLHAKREAEKVALAKKEAKKSESNKTPILSEENSSKSEQKEDNSVNTASSSQGNRTLNVDITYYSAYDGAQTGVTAGGTNMANGNIHTADGYRIVATDPNVIPLGTIMQITTSNGESFMAKSDDTGGAINGHKIDIAVSTPEEALQLGVGTATVEIIE